MRTMSEKTFTYMGHTFSQSSWHVFAGLNAVDNPTNVEKVFAKLKDLKLTCTRMGAYKPRTRPNTFQGHGDACLPYVFALAAEYGIKIIAMEITHERQLEEIEKHRPSSVGVMLQIGTRNAQNFELLKEVGAQQKHPVLFKRGYGITLEESLSACEYINSHGNSKVIFCLRGMKSLFATPHRNFVDFAHVPVIHRLTNMPVCIDPSHAVGASIEDIFHVTAQGSIAGANMLLVDIHPQPATALVDAAQALSLDLLEKYLYDAEIARNAYIKRSQLFNVKVPSTSIP